MFDHDIFLSHAAADASDADKVRATLIAADYKVYCDRFDDLQLDRSRVSAKTAEVLRQRMRRCKMLLFVTTARSAQSKWMPWELGFFDAARGMIVVYPVDEAAQQAANSQEYLSLYEIIPPGSLRREVSARLSAAEVVKLGAIPGAIPGAFPDLGPWKAIQANAIGNIFGRGDHAATAVYGERIGHAMQAPFDFEAAFKLQADVWQAWVRLWQGALSPGRK